VSDFVRAWDMRERVQHWRPKGIRTGHEHQYFVFVA
jgi:hypothetical protein